MYSNIKPIVEELAQNRKDIGAIDASESSEMAKEFNPMGTPAFALINAGMIESIKLGGMSRKRMLKMIDR